MKKSSSPIAEDLDRLRVKNPCPKSWAEMTGTDQKRFCAHCSLHVHNLSAMSPRQISTLAQTPGRRCVAYFQNEDGGVRVRSRLERIRHSFYRTRRLAASLLALLFPFSFIGCDSKENTAQTKISPEAVQQTSVPGENIMLMGKPVSLPATQSSSAPAPEKMLLGDTTGPLQPEPATPGPGPAPMTLGEPVSLPQKTVQDSPAQSGTGK